MLYACYIFFIDSQKNNKDVLNEANEVELVFIQILSPHIKKDTSF